MTCWLLVWKEAGETVLCQVQGTAGEQRQGEGGSGNQEGKRAMSNAANGLQNQFTHDKKEILTAGNNAGLMIQLLIQKIR